MGIIRIYLIRGYTIFSLWPTKQENCKLNRPIKNLIPRWVIHQAPAQKMIKTTISQLFFFLFSNHSPELQIKVGMQQLIMTQLLSSVAGCPRRRLVVW